MNDLATTPSAGRATSPLHGARILVVDDDREVTAMLARFLADEGYRVAAAHDGAEALASLADAAPDLLVLDVVLGPEDGFDVLATIRRTSDVPVIMLTGRGQEVDRVVGLKLGADDYLVKPFSPAELAARMGSVLRRSRPRPAEGKVTLGPLEIDPTTREVWVDGKLIDMTAKEFDLLLFLARAPRQVFSRAQLLEQVWESSSEWQAESTVTEHVRRIRRKIEADPDRPQRILTVRGVGYRFEP